MRKEATNAPPRDRDHEVAPLAIADVSRPDARARRDVANDSSGAIGRNDLLRPGRARFGDPTAVGAGDAGADGQGPKVRPHRASAVASSDGGRRRSGSTGSRRDRERDDHGHDPERHQLLHDPSRRCPQ